MTVNGVTREIDPGRGTSPVIVNGRTLLPIRAIIEALGGSVAWDQAAKAEGWIDDAVNFWQKQN